MALNIDAKYKRKLLVLSKLTWVIWKLQHWDFDGILLSKVENVRA